MSDFNAFSVVPSKLREYHLHDMGDFMSSHPGDHSVDVQVAGRFTPGVERILLALQRLYSARHMNEVCGVMPEFSRDVIWSTPLILMSRKGHLRVNMYLSKFLADLEMEPLLVKVHGPMRSVGSKHLLEIEANVWVKPHRSWLFLPSLLLPKAVPFRTIMKVGVDGPLEAGQIDLVHVRLANWPAAPWPVRSYVGLLTGFLPHATEPIWGLGMDLLGDAFYTRKRQRLTHEAVDTVYDYGNWASRYAYDVLNRGTELAGAAYETTRDTAYNTLSAATDTARNVVGTAQETAARAYDTAAGTAQQAYGTVAGTAQQAYERTAETGRVAYDTASEAARHAYDTTAVKTENVVSDTAARVSDTAARVSDNSAKVSARTAAPSGYDDIRARDVTGAGTTVGTRVPVRKVM